MKNYIIIILTLMAFKANAQEPIKPLAIGDKVPESFWHIPLTVANPSDQKQSITLAGYKGKAIVLDFWASNCVSCIATLPKLDALQQQFKDSLLILPVSYEASAQVNSAFKENALLKGITLVTVTDDAQLKAWFPHSYISHLVWIDAEGRVRAFTNGNYVSEAHLRDLLKSAPLNWPVKRDVLGFNYKKAIFNLNTVNIPVHSVPKVQYHSGLTGHMANIPYKYIHIKDSSNQVQRIAAVNLSIKELYLRSLGLAGSPKLRVQLTAANKERFEHDPKTTYKEDWELQNTYCYEGIFPIQFTAAAIRQKVKADLDFYFGLTSRVEEVKMKCWVISGAKQQKSYSDAERNSAIEMAEVLVLLNGQASFSPVIDETTGKATILLPINESQIIDLSLLRKALAAHGLALTEQERNISLLVLAATDVIK